MLNIKLIVVLNRLRFLKKQAKSNIDKIKNIPKDNCTLPSSPTVELYGFNPR